jgi:hypothetical protein
MSQINDSTRFSPRLEAHGWSNTILGSPIYIGQDLPSASNLTTNVSAGTNYNASYNFDITQDANGNYNDVRNFYTQTSQAEYFTIVLQTSLTTPIPAMVLRVERDPEAPVVSRDYHIDLLVVQLSAFIYKTILDTDTDAWVLNANGTTYDLTLRLDWNEIFGSRPAYTLNTTFKDRSWAGRINIHCAPTDGATFTTITHPVPADPTAVSARFDDFAYCQWIPAWTGWDGRSGYVGRPIMDMKTGLPTFAEAVVEDEYHEGIWTVPAQWDPIDPRDVREVVFPDDEGTRKDDVPA